MSHGKAAASVSSAGTKPLLLLDVPSFDLDEVDWFSSLIGHLQRPIVAGPKLAVHIFDNLSCDNRGQSPCSFIVGKFFANIVGAGAHIVKVVIGPGHVSGNACTEDKVLHWGLPAFAL